MTERAHERGLDALREAEPDLEDLYVRYHEFVRRALRSHYVDASELEDMTQHVFLVLLRRVDEAAQTRSIGAWIWQIARRVAANHHRGRKRSARKHGQLATEAAVAPGSVDPEERYAREEAWSFIGEFLESLDEEACAVFVMSEIEGLRGAEIAARLRLSLPMTYARIRSVRARFDRQLARARGVVPIGVWGMLATATPSVATHALAIGWRVKAALGIAALALLWLFALRRGGDAPPESPGSSMHTSERSDAEAEASARTRALDPDAMRRGPIASEVFAGVIVDPQDAPIAGATVCADRSEDADHPLNDPPACDTSDREGRFRIPGALDRAYSLAAMARGFVPGHFRGRPRDGVRLVLHPGGVELAGVVSDVHGGPIEGAWVAMERRADFALGAMVRTDETGAFSLWVAEGPVSLAVGSDGYAATFELALAPSADVHIELGAESVIAGIVVDGETGEPVEGIRVGALLHEGPEKYANRGRVAYSDAEGRWEIRGLQPQHYVMDAAGERSWGRAQESIDLGIGDRRDDIRIEMMAGAEIVGRIVDAKTGEGCLDGAADTFDEAQSISRGGLTHGDGLVVVGPLTGGAEYQINVTCRDHESRRFDVDLRRGPVAPLEWALSRGGELVVRVVDSTGAPLPDWRVEVTQHGRQTTDLHGSAVFGGIAAGKVSVIAEGPGHPPLVVEDVEVDGLRSELELRATSGVAVHGTVASADGNPVVGALVALQPPEAPRGLAATVRPYHAVTDHAGRFRHASVAAGEYGVWILPADAAVSVRRPGYDARIAGAPLRMVKVRGQKLVLELGALSSISGVVRDEDGDLLMDAQVFAVREHEGGAVDPRGRARLSDHEGRYRIDDLPSGTYALTAYHPDGGIARRAGVAVGASAADLVFPRLGRISGVVKMPDGTVVKAYSINLDVDGRELPFLPVGSMHGRFAATGLEAGRYTLRARSPEGHGEVSVELTAGEQRPGVEITLTPTARVHGRLVDRDGKPLAGWIAGVREAGEFAVTPGRPDTWPELILIRDTGDGGDFVIDAVLPAKQIVVFATPARPADLDPPDEIRFMVDAPQLRGFVPNGVEPIELGDIVVDPLP